MEKLKIIKKKAKNGPGEWTSDFSGESKVTTELKKLTNSSGLVTGTRKMLQSAKSPASSRASTPSNVSNSSKNSRSGKKKKGDDEPKKKKFKMVLEKDEEFEVDYLSPEEEENTEESDSESRGISSGVSDDNFSIDGEEKSEDEISSIENGLIYLDEEFSDIEIDEDYPPLELPESSKDLMIPNHLVLPALGIYETLRHFRSLLRLSPMLFEDFCAALVDEDTNILLTECYVSVLKAILREEDAAGVQFGPQDQKDSKDAALNFLDHMTWPEVVRAYLESTSEHQDVLKVVQDPKFPRVNVEGKVDVLKTLTDIYLASNKIRDKLMTDGVIHYDDHCRVCHKLGDLLCCETCSAVYHLACCDPPLTEVPVDEWQCEMCVAHKLNGVYNCEPQQEFKGQYLRHERIGTDRHGNKYWFLVRRLIVEGAEKVWYYSTLEELQVLVSLLDPDRYEMVLCEALKDVVEEFPKHAKITEELTEDALPDENATMYLSALKARVKEERDQKRKKLEEEERKRKKEEEQTRKESERKQKEMDKEQQGMNDSAKIFEAAEKTINIDQSKTLEASVDVTLKENIGAAVQLPETFITTKHTLSQAVVPSSAPLIVGSQALTPVAVLQNETSSVTNVTVATLTTPTASPSVATIPVTPKVMQGQTKPIQVIKLGANQALKPVQPSGQSATMTIPIRPTTSLLKTLFVLNKDGTKTQITLGPTGKLTTANAQGRGNRQILVLNSAKVALPKVNRELKKLQFTGSGPKTVDVLHNQEAVDQSGLPLRQRPHPTQTQTDAPEHKEPTPPLPPVLPKKKLTHDEEAEIYFRLGEDKAYRQYVNHYTDNTLALNKYQHKEERDRERYLSYKFSLSGEGEFKWVGDILGSEASMLETLRSTLMHLEHQIPLCFMHTKWDRYRNAWGKMVMTCNTPQGFAAALGILEMATRVVVKRSVWRNSHGLPRLKRVTVPEKEEWDKKRKHRTRADEEEGNRNAVWCKYPFPIKSAMVWKVRGEEYRMTGYGGWTWISIARLSKLRPYRPKPFTIVREEKKDPSPIPESKPGTDSPSSEKKGTSLIIPEADTDSEKSTSTTTKSADLMEDHGIFETLVQADTNTSSIVASSSSMTSSAPKESDVMSSSDSTSTASVVTPAVKSEPSVTSSSVKLNCDDIINANDVINVSENLLKRTSVYTKKWSASRVDVLLGWRVVQKDKEDGTETGAATKPDLLETKPVTMTTDSKKPTDVTMATAETKPVSMTTDSKKPTDVTMATAETKHVTVTIDSKKTIADVTMATVETKPVTVTTDSKNPTADVTMATVETKPVTVTTDSKKTTADVTMATVVTKPVTVTTDSKKPTADVTIATVETKPVAMTTDSKKPTDVTMATFVAESKITTRSGIPDQAVPQINRTTLTSNASFATSITNATTEIMHVTTEAKVPDAANQLAPEPNLDAVTKDCSLTSVDGAPADSALSNAVAIEREATITKATEADFVATVVSSSKESHVDIKKPFDTLNDAKAPVTSLTESNGPSNDSMLTPIVINNVAVNIKEEPFTGIEMKSRDMVATVSATISDSINIVSKANITKEGKPESDFIASIEAHTGNPSTGGDVATNNDFKKTTPHVATKVSEELPANVESMAENGIIATEDAMVDVTTTVEANLLGSDSATASMVSAQDSTKLVDSVVETTKTTISDGDKTVTIVETHATTITKTTTVTKTVTSAAVYETREPSKIQEEKTNISSNMVGALTSTSGVATNELRATTDAKTNVPNVIPSMANDTTLGTKLLSQPVKNQPELVVSLPKIEFSKSGRASVVTHQFQRARLSRMSRARRVVRQARDGPLVATQKIWKLERYRKASAASKKEMKLPLPWKFCIGKQKKKSIFRLPASVIRKVAVRGGQYAYRAGFTFGAKWFSGLEQYWFYPCPRPTFSLTWRYKIQNVTTFASVAHLLRVFWHALKWDKMTMRPQTDDVVNTITTDDEIITTELLKRKDDVTTGLHSDYYIRRIRMPILGPEEEALRAIKPAEGYTPSRKGLRSSRRSINSRDRPRKDSEPQVDTIWVPEEQVELWQIRQFDMMLKQQQQHHLQPKVLTQPTSILRSAQNTFITTPSGAILPTLQSLKSSKIESETSGPGFSIVRLPLHQNAQLLQKSTNSTPQGFLNTKTMLGRSSVQKIIGQPQTQFAPYKQGDKQHAIIRSTAAGTQYIVQGGKLMKPIIIKTASPIMTTPIQSKSSIRPNDQAIKFQQQPQPIFPSIKKLPKPVAPHTPPQQQTQIKLSNAQLQQLLRVGSATPIRVSVTLGNGKSGVGQIQVIPPGSQVTPSAGQQLMQTRVGGILKKFLFTLITEIAPAPATTPSAPAILPSSPAMTPSSPATTLPSSPANEVSLHTASLSQRLQQIQRQQLLGRHRNTDMKRLLTDKDLLSGSKPQGLERTPLTSQDMDRPRRKPLSKLQREEGQRQAVVSQVMKSILDRVEHKEKMDTRNRKREEAVLKQKERKEQSEQAKVLNRQTQFLHKHRDQLRQEILKRRAIVEKYLTHAVKNELREDQRKQRRGGSNIMSPPVSKKLKKGLENAITTSSVLSESNVKRPVSGKQPTKRRRTVSPPPDIKKQKMIDTKKKDPNLYCICKTPYDPTKFYIGCDLCLNWFHGSCVDIPEERAKYMSEWICDDCSKAKAQPAQELYCLCLTPYDDAKFYIGCDICQDWYHGDCVGVSEKESEKIDFYMCPRCKSKKRAPSTAIEENILTRADHSDLTKIIKSLQVHKMSWPFLQPVSRFEVPNYHKIIKKPMDLSTVMKKLPSYTMLSDLMSDVSLIFDNCRMFNGAESPLTRCAEIVESVFIGKMREYRAKKKIWDEHSSLHRQNERIQS